MDKNKPLNININQGVEEIIKSNPATNTFKDYIIKNNQDLNLENKDLHLKIKDLENELSLKEEENDKFDERIRYMKGLLKNFYEIKNYALKIKDHQTELLVKQKQMGKRLVVINQDINNFLVYYFWSVWSLIIIDILILQLYIKIIIPPYIKCLFLNLIPFLILSFVFGFLSKKESFTFISKFKKNNAINSINYDLILFNNYQSEIDNKIKDLNKDICKTEEACIGIDIVIDNI